VVPSGTASLMKVASSSVDLGVVAVAVLLTLRVRKLAGAWAGENLIGCLLEEELAFGIEA